MSIKTHFAQVDPANESTGQDYWSSNTACGLIESEVTLSNKVELVTCKKCLVALMKRGNQAFEDFFQIKLPNSNYDSI